MLTRSFGATDPSFIAEGSFPLTLGSYVLRTANRAALRRFPWFARSGLTSRTGRAYSKLHVVRPLFLSVYDRFSTTRRSPQHALRSSRFERPQQRRVRRVVRRLPLHAC